MLIRILDKTVDSDLIQTYVNHLMLADGTRGSVPPTWEPRRRKLHDVIFAAMRVDRYDDDQRQYVNAVDNIICDTFMCPKCQVSVDRRNCCFKCGNLITIPIFQKNLDKQFRKLRVPLDI